MWQLPPKPADDRSTIFKMSDDGSLQIVTIGGVTLAQLTPEETRRLARFLAKWERIQGTWWIR